MIARSGLLLDGGHYKLVSRIAVGGMGEVWRSHDLTTRTPVAIKVLRPEHTGDATSLRRLRFEARNAAMLNHPNITKVLDYGEVEGTGYIVMEYVEGQSLADVLATHSTLAPLRLLPILIQAALGLHAAHSAGVVHRDVKPGNILLGHADHVKLTDFGISVAHGQLPLTDTGKVMGTAQYLSPEQALGNPATAAGDLYSLGVIAYEALAGERPFRGANYVAIALAQVNEPPPPLPASVEKSLADLVMRLMEKDPAKRPGSGAELAGLFGGILDIHRDLVGRLLATRRGSAAPGPARPDSGPPRVTAEQERVPAASIMPAAAPQTAEAPAVPEAAPAEPAGPDGQPPVYPPAPASPPPKRRLPPPHTPEVAQPLPTAPPVPPRQELSYPLPGEPPRPAPRAEAAQPAAAGAQRNPSATPVPPLDQPRPRDEFPSAGAAGPGQPSSTPASGQPGGGPPAPGMPGAGATGPGQPGGAPASGQPGGGPPAPGMPGGGATGPGPQGGAPGPGPGPSAGAALGAAAPAPGPPGGGATGPGQPGGAPASGQPGGGP
ncbi:MAG: serine/threonine protein kinase, partial [Bifidobacteriaceae bacterium]|nr:serine/threonine protein kinase [Bifidobacteriaceae bacterium]